MNLPFNYNTPAVVAEAVLTRLKLWQGEWFADSSDGTPYLQDILGSTTQNSPDVYIKERILTTPGVTAILSYASTLDPVTRNFTVQASIDTIYGVAQLQTTLSPTGAVVGAPTVPVTPSVPVTPTTPTTPTTVPTPIFNPSPGTYNGAQTVSILDALSGVTIYYTLDGTAPTTSSAIYGGPLTVSASQSISAIAVAAGYTNSNVGSASYVITTTLPTAATPTFSPAAGSYTGTQTVSIAAATSGAAIHYTVDGTTPTASSPLYTAPISVTASETVSAIAVATGYTNSAVGSAIYLISAPLTAAATPTFSPVAGTYSTGQTVSIADTTPGAVIHYTIDGTTPNGASPVYSGPITLNASETLSAIAVATGYTNSAVAVAVYTISTATTATPVFNYTSFSGSESALQYAGLATPVVSGAAQIMSGVSHHGATLIYKTKQPPSAFTSQFQFSFVGLNPASITVGGFWFIIENTQSPPNSGNNGLFFGGDANMGGYGGSVAQNPPVGAIGIKFDVSDFSEGPVYPTGGSPSTTGLYLNAGTACGVNGALGAVPANDLNPYGLNFYNNHVFQATLVYDGSLLTMVILDTVSNAQARMVWPLNLANTTNADGNYVGFSGNNATSGVTAAISSWAYSSGFNTRLATPTFSVAGGNYTSAQTVTLSYPAGATCYYTTNGLLPTSSSTRYTAPITVSANQVIHAVAIEAGFTDSLVARASYVIGSSSHAINFPSGFATGNLVAVGFSYLSGTTYRLTDTTTNTSGAVWFPAPVPVSTFSTSFTLALGAGSQGMTFVLQNHTPAYAGLTGVQITGTAGQISFNPSNIPVKVGQYVTIAGTLGGSGSISGYSDSTMYFVGATNGSTTATLQTAAAHTTSQSGTTFTTLPQALTAGTVLTVPTPPGGVDNSTPYFVLASGLSSTTCQLSATLGGSPISVTSSNPSDMICLLGQGSSGLITTTPGTPTGLTFSLNANAVPSGPTVFGSQNNAIGYGGTNALQGTYGQGFGIPNSIAVVFNGYGVGSDPTNGVGLYTNGANPFGSQVATPFTYNQSFNCTLAYDGTTLTLTMQPTAGGTTFTKTWTINIPSTVGSTTAFAGFTGGSGGGAAAIQAVTAWTM